MIKRTLCVNGKCTTIIVSPEESLANVIRGQLGLTGTKVGCGQGQCGACSVILNGKLVRSCVTSMKRVPDEASRDHGRRHRHAGRTCTRSSWPWSLTARRSAVSACRASWCPIKALLDENPDPTRTRGPRVVPGSPERLPVQRLQGDRGRGHGRGQGAAGRDAARGPGVHRCRRTDRIWGTSYPRPSGMAKVTGTLDYGADLGLKMPADTLRLAFVQAEVSHANILGIDTVEAEKMPGVLSGAHPQGRQGQEPHPRLSPPSLATRATAGIAPSSATTKVFKIGDEIAIVCADTEEHARAAAAKGQGGSRGPAGLHERARRHGRGCHRDPSRARRTSTSR